MAHLLLTLLLQLICLIIFSKAEDLDNKNIAAVDSAPQVQYPNLPDGYVAYPDIYVAYKIPNENVTWKEARKRCLLDGAQLALIDSPTKLRYVMDQRKTDKLTHVGIHKLFESEDWVSVKDGALLWSVPWLDGEPVDGYWLCAAIRNDEGGLANFGCDVKGDYVCELSIGDGYVAYPDIGVAYKIPNENVTWLEARRRCHDDGAQLAVIDSAKKLEYVKNQNTVKGFTFVGIHNFFGNDEWVSAGNGTAVASIPWREGEPTDHEDYHCVALWYEVEGLLNYPCDYEGNYVCERPISNGHQH